MDQWYTGHLHKTIPAQHWLASGFVDKCLDFPCLLYIILFGYSYFSKYFLFHLFVERRHFSNFAPFSLRGIKIFKANRSLEQDEDLTGFTFNCKLDGA